MVNPGETAVRALKFLIDAGKNAQERTLARSVQSDDADLGAIEIGKIDVFEYSFLVVVLADSNHGVDDFVRNGAHAGRGILILIKLAMASDSDSRTSKTRIQLGEMQQIGNLSAGIGKFQLSPGPPLVAAALGAGFPLAIVILEE